MAIVVADMIGTGVFTSLGFQAGDIKSGFALLFLWIVGGILAVCGALSYGELAAVMPRSGGEYHYLSKTFHPAIGFLSGWISTTVGFAAPTAAAGMAFGQYFSQVFPLLNPQAIALGIVITIALIHLKDLKIVSYFQNISTILKVSLIVILIVAGLLVSQPQTISFLPTSEDGAIIFSTPFAVSLVFVMYAYSGWNASIYIANEIKDPEKNIPRSLLAGTLIVLGLYLLTNFIFLYSTPIADLAAAKEKVAAVAAQNIFGEIGGKIISLLISIGLISAISSMTWAGPRVTQVIGEDIPFFKLLARKNAKGIPFLAILLQLGIVIFLVITSSFETVVTYLGFTLTLSSFITVLGVFVHRFRYPDMPRPYQTWGYPVTPIIFLLISLWMLIFTFQGKPMESLAGLGTICLGLPVYFIAAKNQLVSSESQISTKD